MQVYRPLYETAYAYRNGGMFDLRPLYMFYKPAIVNGVEVPRFKDVPWSLSGGRTVSLANSATLAGPRGPSSQ